MLPPYFSAEDTEIRDTNAVTSIQVSRKIMIFNAVQNIAVFFSDAGKA